MAKKSSTSSTLPVVTVDDYALEVRDAFPSKDPSEVDQVELTAICSFPASKPYLNIVGEKKYFVVTLHTPVTYKKVIGIITFVFAILGSLGTFLIDVILKHWPI